MGTACLYIVSLLLSKLVFRPCLELRWWGSSNFLCGGLCGYGNNIHTVVITTIIFLPPHHWEVSTSLKESKTTGGGLEMNGGAVGKHPQEVGKRSIEGA